MTNHFELDPISRRQDWEKALAFAFASGAPALVSLYPLFRKNPLIALVAGSVRFLGVFLVALSSSTTAAGQLAVRGVTLRFTSGHLSLGVPLADLDLASARAGDEAPAPSHFFLKNSPAHARVTL